MSSGNLIGTALLTVSLTVAIGLNVITGRPFWRTSTKTRATSNIITSVIANRFHQLTAGLLLWTAPLLPWPIILTWTVGLNPTVLTEWTYILSLIGIPLLISMRIPHVNESTISTRAFFDLVNRADVKMDARWLASVGFRSSLVEMSTCRAPPSPQRTLSGVDAKLKPLTL